MSKPSATYQGSYGKFLDTLRQPASEASEQSILSPVLKVLDEGGGEMGMKDLLGRLKVAPILLVKAVELLKTQCLVTVTSTAADDVVLLTDTGRSVAKLG